jgi:Family of unknown function (DUF6116)
MPTPLGKKERTGLIRHFLSGLSFPKLFLLLCGLFIADAFFPDPIFFVDEIMLGILTVMFGMLKNRKATPVEKSHQIQPPRET